MQTLIFSRYSITLGTIKNENIMKKILFFAAVIFLGSCEPRQGKSVDEVPQKASQVNDIQVKTHEFVAQEVLQANSYTYVKGLEKGDEIWMAIPKREVEIGKTYYYEQAMDMKNFKSKDLDRTFESIYFLSGISDQPNVVSQNGGKAPDDEFHKKKNPSQKQELNIQQEKGITSIGKLYDNLLDFENKKVTVKGIVSKYNPGIMNRNWVHIQDGTGGANSFDLTITTNDIVKVGAIVTFEGTIAINKDFGAGYKYDLIMEEAVQLNKKSDMKVN